MDKTRVILRWALAIVRWLILIPAYLLIAAFCALWVMDLFGSFKDALHGRLDLFLFFCAVLESALLCLVSVLIAPAFKRVVGVVAVLATVGLSLNRWSLVIASEGVTRAIVAEQAAYIVGGLLAFVIISLIEKRRSHIRSTPLPGV